MHEGINVTSSPQMASLLQELSQPRFFVFFFFFFLTKKKKKKKKNPEFQANTIRGKKIADIILKYLFFIFLQLDFPHFSLSSKMTIDYVERIPLRVFEVRFSLYSITPNPTPLLPPPNYVVKVLIYNLYTWS